MWMHPAQTPWASARLQTPTRGFCTSTRAWLVLCMRKHSSLALLHPCAASSSSFSGSAVLLVQGVAFEAAISFLLHISSLFHGPDRQTAWVLQPPDPCLLCLQLPLGQGCACPCLHTGSSPTAWASASWWSRSTKWMLWTSRSRALSEWLSEACFSQLRTLGNSKTIITAIIVTALEERNHTTTYTYTQLWEEAEGWCWSACLACLGYDYHCLPCMAPCWLCLCLQGSAGGGAARAEEGQLQ